MCQEREATNKQAPLFHQKVGSFYDSRAWHCSKPKIKLMLTTATVSPQADR